VAADLTTLHHLAIAGESQNEIVIRFSVPATARGVSPLAEVANNPELSRNPPF
jgi:hypothetical protein